MFNRQSLNRLNTIKVAVAAIIAISFFTLAGGAKASGNFVESVRAMLGMSVDTGTSAGGSGALLKESVFVDQSPDTTFVSTSFVISQAYGGGGGSTGTYLHDYVELKNISLTPQSLTGLQLMYGSATGQFGSSTGNIYALTGGVVQPGKYYLVQLSAAGSAGAPLPTPDEVTTNLTMSGTNGKVALVTSNFAGNTCGGTATPCTLPHPDIIDLVAWGTANNAEGGAATNGGASLTSVQGNVRKNNGCMETDNNNNDFDVITAPVPHNSASAAILCDGGPTPTPTVTPSLTPTPTATPTGTPTLTPTPSPVGTPGVRISQVYGGGGNNGAPLMNDYIELYNAGASTVDLSTWSVQYGGATTSTWIVTNLAGTIAPGQYYLIQQGGGVNGVPLPAPDLTGTTLMGATAGKVALVSDQVQLTGGCPTGPIVDFIGYGLTANCFEGPGPAPAPSNTTADFRGDGGCVETNNNSTDFVIGDPAPRNSTVTHACGGPTPTPTITATPTGTMTPTATPTLTPTPSPVGTPGVRISQVYGGGGNAGAPLTNDYVELFNAGTTTVDLSTWSVQYTSATGTGTWIVTNLEGSIAPGHYYLIQQAAGATMSGSLPTPDVIGTTAMGGTAGKVALVSDQVPQMGQCPLGTVVDLVGYGTANCSEGAPAPAPSNTTAIIRGGNGCLDTNNNETDFTAVEPAPRNSMSPTNSCGGPTPTPTVTPTPSGATLFDFDGDHRSDFTVFRPGDGNWYLQQSTAGFFGVNFGVGSDRLAPADYDGDSKTDVAVYRPSTGVWYILNSADGTVRYEVFGIAEDLPTPADYDGDNKADISVFRPSDGNWYRLNSSNGGFVAIQFGTAGDQPTLGDFDGDNKDDIAVYRPSTGAWYQFYSSDGSFFGEAFGIATDRTVPADYDGDGKTDIAIYRPSDSLWYVKNSATSTYTPYVFGLPQDIPVSADFDGDGKADIGVFRPADGTWYIVRSQDGGFTIFQFGQNGDIPAQSAFNN